MPDSSFTLTFSGAPAPAEVVDAVEAIHVEASVEMASAFQLRLGISESMIGDWTLLETDYFRPLLPVAVRVSNPMGIPETLINGYVSSQGVEYSESPARSVLDVSGMDATLLMSLQEKTQPWPSMSDSSIAAAIFPQHGLVPRVDTTSPNLVEPEGTTIQRGTDIRFLRRLARRNGFHCYVQPEALTGLDQGFFRAPDVSPGPADAVINVDMGPETNTSGFRLSYDMTRPTGAMTMGLDAANKSVLVGVAPLSARVPMGLEPTLFRVTPPPMAHPTDTGLFTSGELQNAAQAVADESSMAVLAEGTVGPDVGILRPGGKVNIRGVGRLFTGTYWVTRVAHSITRQGGHTQRFQARRNAVTMTGAEIFADI